MKRNAALSAMLLIFVAMMIALLVLTEEKKVNNQIEAIKKDDETVMVERSLKLISSTENQDLEFLIEKFEKANDIEIDVEYAGTLEIMDKLNNKEYYDAVWTSNSMWLYMLDESVKVTDSKSTSINPVIFAVKESKARELNLIDRDIYTSEIISAIQSGQLKFSMSNPTQTNSGATAYLGLISSIAGNPEVLKFEHMEDDNIKIQLTDLFNGLVRSSGSEEYLETMFLNGEYDAVVTYESTIINMNQKLSDQGQEILYALYPIDGVSISDSPLAYIDNGEAGKRELFLEFQKYVLSNEGQTALEKEGRRTWYGGVNPSADYEVFDRNWGINTSKYIVPIKMPSTEIIQKALEDYQVKFRRQVYTIFALDYSGSMSGKGYTQLCNAMEYILGEDAEEDLLQFIDKDKITVIPFSTNVIDVWNTTNGDNTTELCNNILSLRPSGSTNIYDTGIKALEQIRQEDFENYNVSVIIMTDGLSNMGSFDDFKLRYEQEGMAVPFYSIMFGSAFEEELQDIAELTNAKVFDGKTDLLKAFKEVRGYN